jgi:hypothetical protein
MNHPSREYRNHQGNDRNLKRIQEISMMARYYVFMLIASKCEGVNYGT